MGMAVQTSYGFRSPKGVPGGLFDLSAHEVATRQAEGSGIAFGSGVVVGTNKGIDVTLPDSSSEAEDFEDGKEAGCFTTSADTATKMAVNAIFLGETDTGIANAEFYQGSITVSASASSGK